MLKTELKSIIKDFYETMTCAMPYEWTNENRALHEKVLHLMLDINGKSDSFELCGQAVADAACINTVSDTLLIGSAADTASELNAAIYDIKSRIIAERKISVLLPFDLDMLTLEVEADAECGVICACKLLAFMKWLDTDNPDNRTVALEIWKTLAMNGDEFSIKALIYAFNSIDDLYNRDHWYGVQTLLNKARNAFCPFIATGNGQSVYAERDASLIMLIRRINQQKNQQKKESCLDRPMLHYALYSTDDFDKKVNTLASGQDFYVLQITENTKRRTKIGFRSSEKVSSDCHIA